MGGGGGNLLDPFPYFCWCFVAHLVTSTSHVFCSDISSPFGDSSGKGPRTFLEDRYKSCMLSGSTRARNPGKSRSYEDNTPHVSLSRGFVHHRHQVIWSLLKREFSFILQEPCTKETLKVNYKIPHLPACWSDYVPFWWVLCRGRGGGAEWCHVAKTATL